MYQIDVPITYEGFSHSVLHTPAAFFSIKSTTKEWCRRFIAAHRSYEVLPYIPPVRQLQPKEETVFPPNQEELREQFQADEDANFFDND